MIGLDGSANASAATKGRRSLGTGMKTSDLDACCLHGEPQNSEKSYAKLTVFS